MLTYITIINKIYTNIVDYDFKTIIIMCPWIHHTINWNKKIHKHKCYRCYNHIHMQLSCKFSLQVLFPYPNSTSKLGVVSETTCISIAITSMANPQNLLSICNDYNAWMQVVQTSILTKIKVVQALIWTTFQFLHVWWKDIDKNFNCKILFWKVLFCVFLGCDGPLILWRFGYLLLFCSS